MTISLQNTILNAIKTSLEKITIANGYQSDIGIVKRGARSLDDMTGFFPGLTLWKEKNIRDDDYQTGSLSILVLHVWGFCQVDAHNDNYDNLDKLVSDVEKVLTSSTHNPTYYTDVFIRDTEYYEGGPENAYGIFDMVVELKYFYDFGSV